MFVIVLPFLGVLVYLMAQTMRCASEEWRRPETDRRPSTSTCEETTGGSAARSPRGKELLDAGAITQEEFEAIEAKALT